MKKIKWLVAFLIVSLVIGVIGCKDPEVEHQHQFTKKWEIDEYYHWKKCNCGEIDFESEHSFGDWQVTKAATEEAEGKQERKCTVCPYTATEAIEKLAHTHKFATDWTKDETNHWYASTCGHITEVSGKAAHSFGDWTVTKAATEEAEGSKERSCTVCGYTATEVIEKLAHTHKFATDWTKDGTYHWHAATCEHTTEVSGKAAHSFGDWTVTKAATEEAEGTKERNCIVCGYTATEAIEKLAHTHKFAEEWTSDSSGHWHAATCEDTDETSGFAEHTFGEYVSNNDATTEADGTKTRECSVCGYEDTVTDEGSKIHVHTFAESLTKDETHHWYAATCEHTTEVSGKVAHSFGDWTVTKTATEESAGSRERSCTVCEYKVTEAIEKLAHTHKFAEEWTSDSSGHWHTATCEHTIEVSGFAEHTFGEYVSNNDATIEADGTKTRECSVCGYKDTVTDEGSKIEGFVFVKGTTINGNGTWTPSSDVFLSGRSLTIPDLIVSDHEVTRGEYKAVMGKDPSTASAYDKDGNELEGDSVLNNPVNTVNWYHAIVYCNKLSMKENLTPCYTINSSTNPNDWGTVPTSSNSTWNAVICNWNANGYRLPTEAEWEWLARGGQNYIYAGSNTADDVAWYTDNTDDTGTREVKTKAPNGYGLYDMSGNVAEWCWDWWSDKISDSTAADGVMSGSHRVLRGESWFSYGVGLHPITSRGNYAVPENLYYSHGFRVVRSSSK